MPELFLALPQRFLSHAAFLHFANQIVALLEKLLGRPGHLAELGIVLAQPVDRPAIAASQAFHDHPQRLRDPTHQGKRKQKQQHHGESAERHPKPLARPVQLTHHWRFIPDDDFGYWLAVPAWEVLRKDDQTIFLGIFKGAWVFPGGKELDLVAREK